MTFPYDQDIDFKSEQSAVDPYSRITFEGGSGNKIIFRSFLYKVINNYTVDDYGPSWDPEDVEEAYSQVEVDKSLWDSLPETDQQALTLLLLEYYKPRDGVQPIIAYFHDGQYGDNLIVGMTNDDLLLDEQEFHLITYNTYIYRSVEDPRTGERYLEEIVPCVVRTFIGGKEYNDPHYIPAMKDYMDIPVEQIPKPEIRWTHKTPDVYVYDRGTAFKVYWAIKVTTQSNEARNFINNGILEILPTQQRQIYSIEIKLPGTVIGSYTCSTTQQQTSIYTFSALITKESSSPRPEFCGMVEYQLKDALTGEDIENSDFFGGRLPIFSQVRGAALIVLQ